MQHGGSNLLLLLTTRPVPVSLLIELISIEHLVFSPFTSQAAARAIAKEWGRPPIFVREGGTVRVTTFLEKTLRSPAIHLPFGQSSDSPHLPNERIRLLNLVTGTRVLESFFAEFAALNPVVHEKSSSFTT